MYSNVIKSTIVYSVAIYIRLSKEDIKKDKNGQIIEAPSESVENQRLLLTNYIKECGYKLYDVYIDDGYTGTNFDRPRFNDMINDILKGNVNMVVTKDLSRLGRDYIKTGEYIEKWFPEHKIRYVALTDNIDTLLDNSNNDIAPFKSLLNDMYAKDLSKKIKTALRVKHKEGKWVGGCTPFGYIQSPLDKNQLIFHEIEAPVVKRIFDMFMSGKSIQSICNTLNDEKVPTFSTTRKRNFSRNGNGGNIYGFWCSSTVKKILKNRLYVGDMIQNRRSRINYKFRKIVPNDMSEWIIVENTHEPIVSKKDFERVQKLLPNNQRRIDKKEHRLLDGLLYCFECKSHIGIRAKDKHGKSYMSCNYYRKYPKMKLCTSHGFDYDKLEEELFLKLKSVIKRLNNDTIMDLVLMEHYKENNIDNTKKLIEKLNHEIDILKATIDTMYMDKLQGKIDDELFNRVYSKNKTNITSKEEKIQEALEQLNSIEDTNNNEELNKLVKEFLLIKTPTRELVLKLIRRIEIHDNKTVDVYFNFKTLEIMYENCNNIS